MNTKRKSEIVDMLCSCAEKCSAPNYFENLQEIGHYLKSNENFIDIANFGMAISSIERLIIINVLKEKDRCVCELEAIIDKSQSTISHHLRKLERAGLIHSYKKGNYNYYHLEKEKASGLVGSLKDLVNPNCCT